MLLAILFITHFSNAQSYSYSARDVNPVTQEVKARVRAVEDQYDLFCKEKKDTGFSLSHFSFCSGDSMLGMPCAKKTIFECKNRDGDLVKKLKALVTYDSRGNAKKLVKFKIKTK